MHHICPVIGPGNGVLPRGHMYLASPAPLDYAAADTYEPIPGAWAGSELRFFTVTEAGVLTYDGPDNMVLLFVGSSDLEASKICNLYYGLFRNGTLLSSQQTPVEIETPNHVYGMAITALVTVDSGDTLQVYSKCDNGTVVLTPHTLSVVFWGGPR